MGSEAITELQPRELEEKHTREWTFHLRILCRDKYSVKIECAGVKMDD